MIWLQGAQAILRWMWSLTVLLSFAAGAADEAGQGIVAAVSGGNAGLSARYRYEFVDQDSFDDDANASTLLLRLNYETGKWRDWVAFAEFDYVGEVLVNDFNSAAGSSSANRSRYPVVADPKGPDLNQMFFQYALNDSWRLRVGRQRIVLDDQRFVGGVAWRQNEQTYDGLSLLYQRDSRLGLSYTYVNRVRRIFGTGVAAGSHRQDSHLLRADFSATDNWRIVGYGYLIDNDDAPAFSTDTFGLRSTYSTAAGEGKLALLGEIALQSSAHNAPVDFATEYFRVQAVYSADKWSLGAGYELLGSDNGQGFRTPLATLHLFNGFADKFLATPGDGLEDLYLKLGFAPKPWSLSLQYHEFRADESSERWGHEFDGVASRAFGERYSLLLKLAFFDADAPAFDDTTKFWAMLTARFR